MTEFIKFIILIITVIVILVAVLKICIVIGSHVDDIRVYEYCVANANAVWQPVCQQIKPAPSIFGW